MDKEEFDQYINEIIDVLKEDANREEIEKEFKKWIEEYKVSSFEAKRGIIKKFGGVFPSSKGKFLKKINEIEGGEKSLDMIARVVSINEKEIQQDGSPKTIYYGIFGDETGTISFTAWTLEKNLEKGDVVEVNNAYAKSWQDKPQLNLGDYTEITKVSKDAIPSNIKTIKKMKIIDLKSRMGLVEVTGNILDVSDKEVMVNDEKRNMKVGNIGDETGEIQFTAWDVDVKKGTLNIKGAYIKSFRGMPQLVFDTRSEITKSDKKIDVIERITDIEKLEDRGGSNITVEGIVLDVKDGSGLILRCPECNRVVQSNKCSVHGEVEPKPDLRIKCIVDDGTGAITAILNKELTEQVLELNLEECIKMTKDAFGSAVVKDKTEKKLINKPVKLKGNVISDDYGLTMIAKNFETIEIKNLTEQAKDMLEELR